ncbi:MAG TPA: ChbG/HpnK family deacetylase, partial [Roseococcus sp.]|nr:ChbG/HpnK family deacetylase [Roseococcus sp.]
HKHYHLHPLIAAALIQAAAGAGIRAMRLPDEDPALVRAADPSSPKLASWALRRWCGVLRRRAAGWGLAAPDRVLGFAWSGAFTAARLRAVLPLLPGGVTELYFHPATGGGFAGSAPGYRYAEELAALTDPGVLAMLEGVPRGGYTAMLA